MPPETLLLGVHAVLMLLLGAYALMKERVELGCVGLGVRTRQCRDEHSVYVHGTDPRPDDGPQEAARKLDSVLSYHEKGGVWKRSFLLALVLAYTAHLAHRATAGAGAGWTLATQHLLFLAITYFYWNFINYHHFRLLKAHGMAHVAVLKRACGLIS
jgi:hypothetical protein